MINQFLGISIVALFLHQIVAQGHNEGGYVQDFDFYDDFQDDSEYVSFENPEHGNVEIESETFLGAIGPQMPHHAKTLVPGNLFGIRDDKTKFPMQSAFPKNRNSDDRMRSSAIIVQPGYSQMVEAAPGALRYNGEIYVYHPYENNGYGYIPPSPPAPIIPTYIAPAYSPPNVFKVNSGGPGYGAAATLVNAGKGKYSSGFAYTRDPLFPAARPNVFNNYYGKALPITQPKRLYRSINPFGNFFAEDEYYDDSAPFDDDAISDNYVDLVYPCDECKDKYLTF